MILIWLKWEYLVWTQTLEVYSESRRRSGGRRVMGVMGQIRFSLQQDSNVSCQHLAVILGTDSIKHSKFRMSGFPSSRPQSVNWVSPRLDCNSLRNTCTHSSPPDSRCKHHNLELKYKICKIYISAELPHLIKYLLPSFNNMKSLIQNMIFWG